MKGTIVLVLGTLLVSTAFGKDKNPADYPLVAHVVSRGRGSADFAVGGQAEAVVPTVVKFQVGNVLYVVGDMHCLSRVTVGTDVHARVKGDFIHILTNEGKTCMAPIEGVYEK